MVMVDTQVVKGGRAGRDFHESHAKYRLRGAKRVIRSHLQANGWRLGRQGSVRDQRGVYSLWGQPPA